MQIKKAKVGLEKPSLPLLASEDVLLALVERLQKDWSLSIVVEEGTDTGALPDWVKLVAGRFTDALVLKNAGVADAKAVLIATDNDDLNLEIALLCRHRFNTPKILALVRNCSNLAAFEAEGVETIHTGSSLALAADTKLRQGFRAASGVGLGQGEIYEVKVLPGSTAIGKTPRHLNPQSWLIAAIYREQTLIVPHGDTVICEGDAILLVGQPEILPGIANFFRAGTSDFPLQYGARVIGLCPQGEDEQIEDEVKYLAESTESTGFSILRTSAEGEEEITPEIVTTPAKTFQPRNLSRILDRLDSGCTVVKAPARRWYHRFGLGETSLFRFLECHTEPTFVSRGTYPYARIALGVQPGKPARFAAEMAVDLARGLGAELTAIIAVPSSLVTGEGYREELEDALESVVRLGEVYGLEVKTKTVTGNPVLKLEEQSDEFDLLVVAHRVRERSSVFNPDVSRYLILRSRCSVLALPHNL